jgi:hypothetical protein
MAGSSPATTTRAAAAVGSDQPLIYAIEKSAKIYFFAKLLPEKQKPCYSVHFEKERRRWPAGRSKWI